MSALHATALIAEDEALLAQTLQAELARAWPQLQVLQTVADGHSAVHSALALAPAVLFLDIRMPGQSGLAAAAELAERWASEAPAGAAFPALVFVTAYDQYAVQAFEAQAVDYLLKPVLPERLARTVQRLRQHLSARAEAAPAVPQALLDQLRALLDGASAARASTAPPRLRVIQASVGNSLRLLPVDEVLAFEAADKYVRVLTAQDAPEGELLIRTPLKDLLPQLDAEVFWPIHRGTVVRVSAIEQVQRDALGRLWLHLRQRPERWAVSRQHASRFKAM